MLIFEYSGHIVGLKAFKAGLSIGWISRSLVASGRGRGREVAETAQHACKTP